MDAGSENVLVASWQERMAGYGRGSVLVGRSVHNQRIERFWRDLRRSVLQTWIGLFVYVEETLFALDRDSAVDKHCFHAVFVPALQGSVQTFVGAWNSHYVRGDRVIVGM